MSILKRLLDKLNSGSDEGDALTIEQLGRIVPDARRCVQCGICVYNCPVGISVRDYAQRGLPMDDPRCITCGNCIEVCPRGTLRWETDAHALLRKNEALTATGRNTGQETRSYGK